MRRILVELILLALVVLFIVNDAPPPYYNILFAVGMTSAFFFGVSMRKRWEARDA